MDEPIMNEEEEDTVFRSQFERANEAQKPDDKSVSKVDSDDENGWLNVRVDDARWEAAKDIPRERDDDTAHQGRIENAPPATEDRMSFSDPVAGNMDPTEPGAPA